MAAYINKHYVMQISLGYKNIFWDAHNQTCPTGTLALPDSQL